jgi:hypothetical protein
MTCLSAAAGIQELKDSPSKQPPHTAKHNGIAILMDDDESVHTKAAAAMPHLGFEVWKTENGTRTLEQSRRAKEADPDAQTISLSDYLAEHCMSDYTQCGLQSAVATPYNLHDIEAGVVAERTSH